jgi:hypothetical protein
VAFSDSTIWLLRLLLVGNVCDEYADEKVAIKVEVLSLICKNTTIPVLDIKA